MCEKPFSPKDRNAINNTFSTDCVMHIFTMYFGNATICTFTVLNIYGRRRCCRVVCVWVFLLILNRNIATLRFLDINQQMHVYNSHYRCYIYCWRRTFNASGLLWLKITGLYEYPQQITERKVVEKASFKSMKYT